MSKESEEVVDTTFSCCACGIAGIDDIKLKDCDECDLVKYCSDECREDHKLEHEEACKKRAAELRDELLFKQPESSHRGDCPICSLPLPIDATKSRLHDCCNKVICSGCYANEKREFIEAGPEPTCPFCQESILMTDEQVDKRNMKRIEMNDPVAMYQLGIRQFSEENYSTAFEYFSKAAELGDVDAHYQLVFMYHYGHGILEKDTGKTFYHLEEAAIGGHPEARYDLGIAEWKNGNYARAVKHWIIAAAQGHDEAIQTLEECHEKGFFSKDNLASTLRAHKVAVDATKSPEREAVEQETRNSDLRDELLFKQPESTHLGDCSICCLPLSFDQSKSNMYSCCSKFICIGCSHANHIREKRMRLQQKCPFCRESLPETSEESDKRRMKRIDANDPVALCVQGVKQYDQGEHSTALEYLTKAAQLGDVNAHYRLADLYREGQGVEKDTGKAIYHLEEAATSGHPGARYELGKYEWFDNRNAERAVKHWIIAAAQGDDFSMKMLMKMFKSGFMEKETLAAALRAHKATIDATKSPERDAAEEYRKKNLC